jgi:hypothetical protein
MGFTFDDTDKKGVANSLADRERLIAERPENQEVILPYIGGEEVNDNPAQAFHRYTIDFYDRSESECRERWPELMEIVEARVRPERRKQKRKALRERWWQYAEKRPGLHAALQGVDRVLATNCGATPQYALAFQPTGRVFAHKLVIFPLETEASFCALQSRPHEIWARFFSATLKDDLQYAPSDCFETFPFPDGWQDEPQLEQAGQTYYDFRAGLMVANDEGLTKTYNRFHDPDEADPEIATLRDHHAAMDRAVLTAYGWDDIPTECEFLLDYEVEDDDGDTKRKKPYRYRWPDEVRDEVLVRLIELNHQRAAEEQASGTALVKQTKKAGKPKRAKMPQAEGMF